jgi:hypothetical protein
MVSAQLLTFKIPLQKLTKPYSQFETFQQLEPVCSFPNPP